MKRARVIELERTCGSCPSQWEGVLDDGRAVYVRYRMDVGRIGIGVDIDAAVDATMDDLDLHVWEGGGESPGFMHDATMLAILGQHLDLADGLLP